MPVLEKYFNGEFNQCLAGIGIAFVSIMAAILFFLYGKSFVKGMAYPFIGISLILLIICAGIVYRTPKDLRRVSEMYHASSMVVKSTELPRMEKVMSNFKSLIRIELAIGVAGIFLMVFFWKKDFVSGIGAGFALQAALMLCFDMIAKSRGQDYLDYLRAL